MTNTILSHKAFFANKKAVCWYLKLDRYQRKQFKVLFIDKTKINNNRFKSIILFRSSMKDDFMQNAFFEAAKEIDTQIKIEDLF